jgi:hypothetical protein
MTNMLSYENTLTECSKAYCRNEWRSIVREYGRKAFEEKVRTEMYTGQKLRDSLTVFIVFLALLEVNENTDVEHV